MQNKLRWLQVIWSVRISLSLLSQRKKVYDSEKKIMTAKKSARQRKKFTIFFSLSRLRSKFWQRKKVVIFFRCQGFFSLSRLFFAVMYFFRCHDFSTRSTFCRSFLSKLINENEKFHLFLNIFILLNVFEDCIKVM